MNTLIGLLPALALGTFLAPAASYAHTTTVFATGLQEPVKLSLTLDGNLLVAENGTGNNDGSLARVDGGGQILRLLTGLPSGIEETGGASGPTASVVDGCCVIHLTIGAGDTLRFSPNGPPVAVPNQTGPVSPLFSSVLRLVSSRPLDQLSAGFALSRDDHEALADGRTVTLANGAGDTLWVRLAVDFNGVRPDARINVRGSNPFQIVRAQGGGYFVADASANTLLQLGPGWPQVVVRFPPIPMAPGTIPPVSESVPTSVRHYKGQQYLVSLLSGVPFAPGAASIRLVNAKTGSDTPFITGLTAVTDVLKIGNEIYVLEISANLQGGAPGRLLRFRNRNAQPVEVAFPVIGGSGLAYDPKRNAIFVAELFTGRILRVQR